MLEKNILDKIADFFKSIGTRKASGEPIDLGRPKHDFETQEKEIHITPDEPVRGKGDLQDKKDDQIIQLVKDKETGRNTKATTARVETKETTTIVATVKPRKELSEAIEALRVQYPWRKLKAEKPLSVQTLPEPFYFLTSDNQPVEAGKFEVSFIKELLTKAAEAGIENKFTFSISSTMSVIVKYKKKLVGRVYLHGRKHHMTFKTDAKIVTEENLTLSECKKLIPIWIGQIKDSLRA